MKILILTNGTYGDYNFCKQDEGFDYIICADRGLCHARVLGIMPNLIVGDFDSTNEQDLTYFKEQGVQIETFDTHKDETDTEIAVSKAIQKGATEVTIYGGLGSRLDHNLANVHLLYKLLRAGIKGKLVNPNHTVYLAEKYRLIKGKKGDLVSLIPFAGRVTGVTTKSLAYPLKKAEIHIGTSLGISNVLEEDTAEIWLDEGILIVIMAQD
ncbi:MAG: thiamine diphosphokinase [Candidatus Cellulosilyticum pullistercoris]|uniref:Thiamine diphosphokinase n=1 Tax=Candidatus Cellulosilyticum pullistercoris TaxID=2838521 RepID=A0A9E2KEG9_9FIRM|nr:thiamine diphosphokinase [Candidatus Cellulosilyticum pullistercoris]